MVVMKHKSKDLKIIQEGDKFFLEGMGSKEAKTSSFVAKAKASGVWESPSTPAPQPQPAPAPKVEQKPAPQPAPQQAPPKGPAPEKKTEQPVQQSGPAQVMQKRPERPVRPSR